MPRLEIAQAVEREGDADGVEHGEDVDDFLGDGAADRRWLEPHQRRFDGTLVQSAWRRKNAGMSR